MSAPAGVVDDLLAGRYRLTSRMAAGAFGEVWRARDLLLDRDVAVKTLRPEIAEDEAARERFRAEARSTARLSHPGIAAVYDAGEDDGRAWLVLELVEGESLQQVLRSSGPLSPERTLDVVAQAAAALQVAHDRGIVHRDVKPGNLLLRPDGTLKVTDFGIASVAGGSRLTRTGELVGTAAYLSPEQAAGDPASALSDLYALGVVAYECLSGCVPFAFDTPVAVLLAHTRTAPPPLPPGVPVPVRELVAALLEKDRVSRPASAREVVRRAESVRAGLAGTSTGSPVRPAVAAPSAAQDRTAPTTALLPAAGARPPLTVRPARPVGRTARPGLAGRPGQRRAVRATALLLGLLAVAFGWRESSGERADPAPARSPAPVTSVAPSSPAEQPSGSAGAPAVPAPAGPAPVEPADEPAPAGEGGAPQQQAPQQPAPQQPAPQQGQEPPAPPAGNTGGQGQDAAPDAADKAADKAAKAAEKAAEKAQNAPGGNGRGNGGGG